MFITSRQFLVPCGPYLPNAPYSNGSTRKSSSHGHLLYDGEGRPVPPFEPIPPSYDRPPPWVGGASKKRGTSLLSHRFRSTEPTHLRWRLWSLCRR